MLRYNKNIPDGTRDILFGEADLYDEITSSLARVYEEDGYSKIITPSIEYYDVFDYLGQSLDQEEMYKLTDNKGRLAVLRADNTTPVARVIATKLRSCDPPFMFYYEQNVYRHGGNYTGARSEILQSGVEYAGIGGIRCDLACVATAIKALRSLNVGFKLEIGHVGFANALIDEMGLTAEQNEAVREYINAKNTMSLGFLKTESDLSKIKQLPRLCGEREVFGHARKLAGGNETALKALESVEELYTYLYDAGLADDILVDLGIAHPIEYYTGFVFRGYIEGAGEHVLSGGRYDNLIGCFGRSLPATGFAINVGLAADALYKKRGLPNNASAEYVIHYDPAAFAEAVALQRQCAEKGKRAILSCYADADDTYAYAEKTGAAYMTLVDKSGCREIEVYRENGACRKKFEV
jgi:ATP phosphoribosyltransferase regulatory subunit